MTWQRSPDGRTNMTSRCTWTARGCGSPRRITGARYAEIAALFDTVYVSFYKGIGGIAGGADWPG